MEFFLIELLNEYELKKIHYLCEGCFDILKPSLFVVNELLKLGHNPTCVVKVFNVQKLHHFRHSK